MAEAESDSVLTVGAVAQRLGIAVSTLRSWDRRYGLGPSEHRPGKHRRYSGQDVHRLRRMMSLTADGVPPAAAAQAALGAETAAVSARDGGGTGAVAIGRADRAVRGLARAASRLDIDTVRSLVTAHVAERGVTQTWERLLIPLLESLGQRFEAGRDVVAVEHAATAGILAALHAVSTPTQRQRLPALLACAPEEQHALPLEALSAALAEQLCPTRLLGARVPAEALRDAVHKLGPTCMVVWAHTHETARRVPIAELAKQCELLLLAGPGWSQVRAASEYWCPLSLGEAVEAIVDAGGLTESAR